MGTTSGEQNIAAAAKTTLQTATDTTVDDTSKISVAGASSLLFQKPTCLKSDEKTRPPLEERMTDPEQLDQSVSDTADQVPAETKQDAAENTITYLLVLMGPLLIIFLICASLYKANHEHSHETEEF